jgi:tetratricopeptide (TPR) repeat protein
VKNDDSILGENKLEFLERILKLECIDKTIVNHNHENERTRINLKWTVLTECGIWYRKLGLYDKAIKHFDKVRSIQLKIIIIILNIFRQM